MVHGQGESLISSWDVDFGTTKTLPKKPREGENAREKAIDQ